MTKGQEIRFAGIIPARYASSRFPGKPLAMIGNKTMIERVYDKASRALDTVYVATDDKRISDAVEAFGGKAVMTSESHRSGTDRCAEAAAIIASREGRDIRVIINIQGDEPFIKPEQVTLLMSCFDDPEVEIATLVRRCGKGEDIFNPNQPKAILDNKGFALYFSRAAIPFIRDAERELWSSRHAYFKHLGIYAYTKETLIEITRLRQSTLEIAESLEQNRWLENGYRVKAAVTEWESPGIDTPEDLIRAKSFLDSNI